MQHLPYSSPLPCVRCHGCTATSVLEFRDGRVATGNYVLWIANFYSVLLRQMGATVDLSITSKLLEVHSLSRVLCTRIFVDTTAANQHRGNADDAPPKRRYWSKDPMRLRNCAHRIHPNRVEDIDRIYVPCRCSSMKSIPRWRFFDWLQNTRHADGRMIASSCWNRGSAPHATNT